MSRDWQKDMERVENFADYQQWIDDPEPIEIVLKYWLQQYAAEKERGDRLHNAIERAVSQSWGVKMLDLLDIKKELQASLYPKEGETNE